MHKLGHKIVVVNSAGNPEIVVAIDWAELLHREILSEVPVQIRQRLIPKVFNGNETGTRIEVTVLRDESWSAVRYETLLDLSLQSVRHFVVRVAFVPNWSSNQSRMVGRATRSEVRHGIVIVSCIRAGMR